jgi:UDP-N-acetylglucosamine--N-acetylmuramyl-(pentapeptide) pyrophosphoryl-undecaprenol N-acetylglucosamine transferase
MEQQKAAIHLAQGDLSAARVAQLLQSTSRADCLAMAQAARGVGKRNANEEIADVLEQLANKNKQ